MSCILSGYTRDMPGIALVRVSSSQAGSLKEASSAERYRSKSTAGLLCSHCNQHTQAVQATHDTYAAAWCLAVIGLKMGAALLKHLEAAKEAGSLPDVIVTDGLTSVSPSNLAAAASVLCSLLGTTWQALAQAVLVCQRCCIKASQI